MSLYLISLKYIAEIHIYKKCTSVTRSLGESEAAGPPRHLGVNTRLSGGGLLRHQMAVCLTWTVIDFKPSCHV